MKKLLCILLVLLCPVWALAELEMDVEKNYITFPELDEMTGYFRKSSEWTVIHRGNLEEHMELLMARGETEEEIRARFAEDSLLWEACKTGLPEDACFRMERFEDASTRDVWHLRHLSSAERKELLQTANDGVLFPQYETFSAEYEGNGGAAYISCGFTTVPPTAYESGKMHIRYINGRQYVLTYAVKGRMAGRSKLRSSGENNIITGYSPFNTLKFGVKLQPQMPDFALDEPLPAQADVGEMTVTGTVTKGAKLTVALNGEKISCQVDKKGTFTAVLPLDKAMDHEVTFTVTHKKYTDRVETYTVNASAHRTPLTLSSAPEDGALAGEHLIAGSTEPGAAVNICLDGREPVELIADGEGSFSHTMEIMDDQYHLLRVSAQAEGKDPSLTEKLFYTEYETFKDGLDAFEKQLTELTVAELAADPEAHLGERVKISVRVKEVSFTEEGLGILANYNPPKGSRHEKTPLYLSMYGYGQDQIQPDMVVTVYATVRGQKETEGENRLELLVQYGTYLVMR